MAVARRQAGVGVGLVILASALAGFTAWVGAASQNTGVRFGDLMQAGLNVAPPAVFVLGIGGLAFGLWPRGAIGVTYGLVVWSFLVETIASVFNSNHWLRDMSPLLHITPAPAADPNWTSAVWLVGLGIPGGRGRHCGVRSPGPTGCMTVRVRGRSRVPHPRRSRRGPQW